MLGPIFKPHGIDVHKWDYACSHDDPYDNIIVTPWANMQMSDDAHDYWSRRVAKGGRMIGL